MSEPLYGPNGEYLGILGNLRGVGPDKYKEIKQAEIDERMERVKQGYDFSNPKRFDGPDPLQAALDAKNSQSDPRRGDAFQERGGFSSQLNNAFQLAGARPIMETLDRGMDDRSDEIGKVGETIPATTGFPISPDDGLSLPRTAEQKPPAPLTGTTSEGVMANFQPDPQRDSAQNLLDQTVANVEPDKGSTATPTPDQQRDASVQQLDTKAGSAPSSGEMASPIKMAGETSLEGLQPASQTKGKVYNPEINSYPAVLERREDAAAQDMSYGDVSPEQFNNFENQQDPYPQSQGTEFMQQYADIPAGQPQPNYQATFPEYMNEYSPQQMGNFANFESNMPSYSQDNEYQYYEPYDSGSQYQAQQMEDFGPYDMGNFMDFNQVPQSQNNFSEAGNFFATANSQMENAAAQETKADKRIRLAGQMGSAGKRM